MIVRIVSVPLDQGRPVTSQLPYETKVGGEPGGAEEDQMEPNAMPFPGHKQYMLR